MPSVPNANEKKLDDPSGGASVKADFSGIYSAIRDLKAFSIARADVGVRMFIAKQVVPTIQ